MAKATFSTWPKSATEFLRDTSYGFSDHFVIIAGLTCRRNQPFFFESTRVEFVGVRIDSSFWRSADFSFYVLKLDISSLFRHDSNFPVSSASQHFSDLIEKCPDGFDPTSTYASALLFEVSSIFTLS